MPRAKKKQKTEEKSDAEKEIYLVASGDLRLSGLSIVYRSNNNKQIKNVGKRKKKWRKLLLLLLKMKVPKIY